MVIFSTPWWGQMVGDAAAYSGMHIVAEAVVVPMLLGVSRRRLTPGERTEMAGK
jgi:hypothetical protein